MRFGRRINSAIVSSIARTLWSKKREDGLAPPSLNDSSGTRMRRMRVRGMPALFHDLHGGCEGLGRGLQHAEVHAALQLRRIERRHVAAGGYLAIDEEENP